MIGNRLINDICLLRTKEPKLVKDALEDKDQIKARRDRINWEKKDMEYSS